MTFDNTFTHPSYGMANVSRVHGDIQCFGSTVVAHDYLVFEVHTCKASRDLSNNWYFPDRLKLRLRMTETQFSRLITTPNTTGVPVTLEFVDGAQIDRFPGNPDQLQTFQKEVKASVSKASDAVKAAKQKVADLPDRPNKTQIKELQAALASLLTQVESNIPFVEDQAIRALEKHVETAKAEFEAWASRTYPQVNGGENPPELTGV